MAKIIGNPTVTPVMPSDWAQKDETKVDYIKNKPTKVSQFENDAGYVKNRDLNFQYGEGADSVVQRTSVETQEGAQSTAEGTGAFSTGRWNRASADCAVAMNYNNDVSGKWSFACGYGNNVPGQGAFVCGAKNKVDGMVAMATGTSCTATGRYSFVGGNNSEAAHESSFVFGHYLKSTNAYTTAFGKFNDYSNGKNIFVVGFGKDENNRGNVLAVNRDGILEIKPSYIAPVGSEARLKLGNTTIAESQLKELLEINVDEAITGQLTLAILPLENDIGMLFKQVGEIETALDSILAIQEVIVGGES